jgi:hypothetical protein
MAAGRAAGLGAGRSIFELVIGLRFALAEPLFAAGAFARPPPSPRASL